MLYFSEIKGKNVYTEDEIFVGRLVDMIFLAEDHPKITKVVIKTYHDSGLIVPMDSILKLDDKIIIEKNYTFAKLGHNELYMMKNLVDTQIIDIVGRKIVRVNDVVLAEKPDYHIAGVDISFLGILRWLKLEDVASKFFSNFGVKLTSSFLSWGDIQPLELSRGHVKIKKESKRFEKIRPEDLADYLEQTNILNVKNILNMLDMRKAAEVIGQLNINYQTALFKHFTTEKIAKIISFVDPEEAVDVLLTLPKNKREKVLDALSADTREQIEYLLRLSKTPIGDVLTTEYLTVHSDVTVKQAIETLKKEANDFHSLYYVYVVNKDNQLVGVFSLHELLLKNLDVPVYKFMTQNLSVVYLTTPELAVFKKMVKYKLSALPVVDTEKQILGIVNFDDIVDLITNVHD